MPVRAWRRSIAAVRRHPALLIACSLSLVALGGRNASPPAVVIHELA
ncbi:MAG: hypothetical protein PHV11_01635 [Candidatus Bipolaricaulis sp.]|nr:hypothetical protein [Candidatus Bipolaricaulis sp.]MDD5219255.1 hypothetical protein [Candidatus Bipolaricaulis sp.]MDD5647211.1 hypothetical protein [Candidatus Bipolaricaulis sp.]